MKTLRLGGAASGVGLALGMLAGCGGSQPPIGAPGAMAQSRAITSQAKHSWIVDAAEAKSQDLIYATDTSCGICNRVDILTVNSSERFSLNGLIGGVLF